MKHTKGKWEVKQSGGKREVVCGDMTIASGLYDENKSPSIEEVDANANLIALAPEMLRLIKDIVRIEKKLGHEGSSIFWLCEDFLSKIKKANKKGE